MIVDREYRKGDIIYRQGEKAEQIFFVKFGMVELHVDYGTPDDKCIGTVGEGKVFGELGLIESRPRTMTTVCRETTIVTIVDRDSFHDYIQDNPNKMVVIMESLSLRIRRQSQKLITACRTVAEYVDEKNSKGTANKELVSRMKELAKENAKADQ